MIHPVMVVPILAPIITDKPCIIGINPALIKLIMSNITAEED